LFQSYDSNLNLNPARARANYIEMIQDQAREYLLSLNQELNKNN
jgi:hypothetical protein